MRSVSSAFIYIVVETSSRKMQFKGVFDVEAPRERVFDLMTDPHQVAQCMPDLQSLEVRSRDDFDATVRVGVSFIRGDFVLHFKTAGKEPGSYAKLLAHGTGSGSALDMEIEMKLTEGKGGGTSMNWSVEARISGKIASLGQRLLDSQAERIVKQLFDCLRQKLERP